MIFWLYVSKFLVYNCPTFLFISVQLFGFGPIFEKVVVVVEAIVGRSIEKALRQVLQNIDN